jgi:hypothetical protein
MKRLALLAFSTLAIASQSLAASAEGLAEQHGWKPYFLSFPGRGVNPATFPIESATGKSLPSWTSSIVSPVDGKTYKFTILGTNPQTKPVSTTINYIPIVLKVKWPGGVSDPTKPACSDTVSVSNRFYQGPNFASTPLVSNGVNVGTTQITDAFMRAEFWQYASGTNYGVFLKAAAPVRVVDVTVKSAVKVVAGPCSGAGHDLIGIDINTYDALVQSIDKKYAKPTQLPLILTYNVVQTEGGSCCIIGYHSTYVAANGATQVYSVGSYTDAGIFTAPIDDIHAWTHEIGEAFNDPSGTNPTPAWGHIGQVSGCQNNLEVGDPLTGTPFALTYNGFAYHPQELVFFNWFFRSAAIGTGGLASFEGSFTAGQPTVCT